MTEQDGEDVELPGGNHIPSEQRGCGKKTLSDPNALLVNICQVQCCTACDLWININSSQVKRKVLKNPQVNIGKYKQGSLTVLKEENI